MEKVLILEGLKAERIMLKHKYKESEIVPSVFGAINCIKKNDYDIIVIGGAIDNIFNLNKLIENYFPVEWEDIDEVEYYPVKLGEIFRNFCENNWQRRPKIIIYATTYDYKFKGCWRNNNEEIIKFIEKHDMGWFDKIKRNMSKDVKMLLN